MSKVDEVTLGDLRKSFVRYRPFVAVVAAIALLMIVLPGKNSGGGATSANAAGTPYAQSGNVTAGGDGGTEGTGTDGSSTAGGAQAPGAPNVSSGGSGGTASAGTGSSGASGGGSGGGGGGGNQV